MKAVVFVLATIFAVGLADVLDPSICTSAGRVCASCTELATCVWAEGEYDIVHLQYCDAGETCTPEGCTAEPVYGCYEPLPFVCKSKGMFPEPFDCRKYHFCVPDNGQITDYTVACDSGYGYDPTTFSCSNRLENNVCPDLVPECHTAGQTGALSNPSFYYLCAEYSESDRSLYPFLFACPNGEHYQDYSCKAARQYAIDSIL